MTVKLQENHQIEYEIVHVSTPLDNLIFGDLVWYELSLKEQQSFMHTSLMTALHYHLEHNSDYLHFYERTMTPGAYDRIDLETVPLLSTRLFKYRLIQSVADQDIEQWYVSSGTQGMQSRICRDRVSLERLLGSVRSSVGLIRSWHEDELTIVNLGPGREDAGNVWFQYVMSLVELMYTTYSVIPDGRLCPDAVLELLGYLLARPGAVALIGPPFIVIDLCEAMALRDKTFTAGERLTVLTAGGWKRHSGRKLQRDDFDSTVQRTFGLTHRSQLRDAFNQVELNTVFIECEAQEKHVPPWVFCAARDPRTLNVLPDGQIGMLSYLDASANSYPCFLLTDDVGEVYIGECGCGREGTRVRVHRRLETRIQKGCALAMERNQ